MTATPVVLVVGVIGLAAAVLIAWREPERRLRWATVSGAIIGFVLALLVALASGKSAAAALAVGTVSAAALALVLVSQWRIIRRLIRPR